METGLNAVRCARDIEGNTAGHSGHIRLITGAWHSERANVCCVAAAEQCKAQGDELSLCTVYCTVIVARALDFIRTDRLVATVSSDTVEL